MTALHAHTPSELLTSVLAGLERTREGVEPAWLHERRERAGAWFRSHGFPQPKDERWRFTSLRAITRIPFAPTLTASPTTKLRGQIDELFGVDSGHRLIVVNGRPLLPDASAPPGVEIVLLSKLLRSGGDRLERYLGRSDPAHAFAALNTALFEDALVVIARQGAQIDRPLHVVNVALSGERPTLSYPRLLVVAEPASTFTLIESHVEIGAQPHLTSSVTELFVEDGAAVEHVLVHYGTSHAHRVGSLAVEQGNDSRYASRVVSLGGALTRLDVHARLTGRGAECTLDGLYLVDGDEHVDHQTLVEHVAEHATSLEKYKGVLAGRGHAVFDGTVIVHKGAQHTNAHQENRNILLSDEAIVNTKPHLEIDADDVRCSHGATIGQLDPNHLHYLRTRGIDSTSARAILSYAFAQEIVERIKNLEARERVTRAVLARIPQGQIVRELFS
jgi:Fe-S cluster assembly protein SufD